MIKGAVFTVYLLLFGFFLILSGKLTAEVLLVGLFLTLILAILLYVFFGYTPKKDLRALTKLPLFLVYIAVLMKEIVKAAFSVIRLILDRRVPIEPSLVTFRPELQSDFGRFILANSITLTPGTITVEIKDGVFTVHCLRRNMLDTSRDSVFLRWIRRLEA